LDVSSRGVPSEAAIINSQLTHKVKYLEDLVFFSIHIVGAALSSYFLGSFPLLLVQSSWIIKALVL